MNVQSMHIVNGIVLVLWWQQWQAVAFLVYLFYFKTLVHSNVQ